MHIRPYLKKKKHYLAAIANGLLFVRTGSFHADFFDHEWLYSPIPIELWRPEFVKSVKNILVFGSIAFLKVLTVVISPFYVKITSQFEPSFGGSIIDAAKFNMFFKNEHPMDPKHIMSALEPLKFAFFSQVRI